MAGSVVRKKILVNTQVLWDLMDLRSLSQNDLAEVLGISRGYLSQLTNAKRSPSAKTRRLMLEALDVEFNDLFTMEEAGDER